MFEESRVLEAIGITVLAVLIPTGLVVLATRAIWKTSAGKALQIVSIAISSLAITLASIGLGSATIWQGPSGEWARLALLPAFIISLPAGLIACVIGVTVRSGLPRLRKIAIAMSVAALLSPFVAAFLAR